MIAGMLAPSTPKTDRQITGNGTPVRWLGFATRLQKNSTMEMPTMRQMKTCQLVSPSAKRLPAVTYPPTLCTSDIQNAKMLYQDQFWSRSGARSSLVRRGWYHGLMTPTPAGCSALGGAGASMMSVTVVPLGRSGGRAALPEMA